MKLCSFKCLTITFQGNGPLDFSEICFMYATIDIMVRGDNWFICSGKLDLIKHWGSFVVINRDFNVSKAGCLIYGT